MGNRVRKEPIPVLHVWWENPVKNRQKAQNCSPTRLSENTDARQDFLSFRVLQKHAVFRKGTHFVWMFAGS